MPDYVKAPRFLMVWNWLVKTNLAFAATALMALLAANSTSSGQGSADAG
jgi:hypothetical protein